jgi:hypothetical protein
MATLPFYIALFVHIVSFVTGFGAVIVIDMFGLLWLLGKQPMEQVNKVANVTQRLIWLGWFGLVASGLVLITSKGYVDNLTMLKLFAVAMLGLNGIFLHFIKKSMERQANQNEVSRLTMFRIGLSSTISQAGWWSALTIGYLHRQWRHNIPWPHHPVRFMVIAVIVILIVAFVGEKTLAQKKN